MATDRGCICGSRFTAQEVCLILEAGAKHGVRELSVSGLHVQFGQPADREDSPLPVPQGIAPVPFDLTEAQHTTLAKDGLERDELEVRQEQLAELLITDPLRYEEMIRNGELTDASTGRDGDSPDGDDDAD